MTRALSPSAFRCVTFLALSAFLLAGRVQAADPVKQPPVQPAIGAGPEEVDEDQPLDPKQIKVGDRIKIVLREINQRSGGIVFTASKAAYGTVRSVAKVEFDGKENVIFEIAPYGSDGKTILKYDKETGQTFRVEPTIKFGTLQIEKIFPMPSDEDMKKVAGYRDTGAGIGEMDSAVMAMGEEKAAVDRRIKLLTEQVSSLKLAIADHQAAAVSALKPGVARTREKTGGTAQVDSAADSAAQEVAVERRNAEEAAVIRLKFRLSQKEDDLREEMKKATDYYGIPGVNSEELDSLTPSERRILLTSRASALGGQIRSLKQAMSDHQAGAVSALKPGVVRTREKTGGTAQVDSAADSAAQEVVVERKNSEAAAMIRLRARLEEKQDELRIVNKELADLSK